jgi:TolB-like protein/Flp pilus assembly protein TadD
VPVQVWRWLADGAPAPLSRGQEPLAPPDRPSIAVLPFTNISSDAEQEYFADGLTEDLITDISKLAGLTVIARNSSFTFKGRQVDVKEAARTLGVRNILEGSVRKMGTRVRINAQLIDGISGSHIWAERYDGDLADIFDLQDEIRDKIVAALEVNLTQQDSDRSKHRATVNIAAYDLFLRGGTKFFTMSPDGFVEAEQLLRQAIETDGNSALPYNYLNFIRLAGWIFIWPDQSGGLDGALAYAEKAIALDDKLGMARTQLGWTQLWMGRHDAAIANLERGVELDPANAEGYAYLAETLNYTGEPERAVEMTQKALENDPMLPPNCQFHLGHSYYLLGRFEEAAETISGALKIVPEFPAGHLVLAAVYSELGQLEAAATEIEILSELTPEYSVKEIDRIYQHRPAAVKQRFLAALGKAGMRQG